LEYSPARHDLSDNDRLVDGDRIDWEVMAGTAQIHLPPDSDRVLAAALEAAAVLVVVIDPAGVPVWVNHAATEVTGFDRDALLAESILERVAPEQREEAEHILERLWRGKARLLLVTDGAEPMRWFSRGARGTIEGYHVEAVDTTAAGDAFVGGLLARLATEGVTPGRFDTLIADERRLVDLIRFAAACGAITATRKGSFTAIPDQAEVKAFMEKHA